MGVSRASFPRFKRAQAPLRIELTEDDVAILCHLRRHRFVRTTDIYRLLSHRSPDKLSRRLAHLYRARFIDRPLSQIDQFRCAGSQPLVYGLDNVGARYLADRLQIAVNSGDWSLRNRRYTRENLDHTLAITRFMVDLELACRARDNIDLVHAEDIAAGSAGRWSVTLPWHGSRATVTVAPDAVFGLTVRTTEGRTLRSFYFVEVDRGSMTIVPSEAVRRSDAFLYRSSVLRKLLAYAVSHEENLHQSHFNIPAARVLMLTTKAARAEDMRLAAQRLVTEPLNVPAGLFLFGALCDGDPLDQPLQDVASTTTSLVGAFGR